MSTVPETRPRIDPSGGSAAAILERGDTIRAIQTQYATAVVVQKPRELSVVLDKCLKEAAMAGEAVFYGWGSGQDRVEGPSKECAMIAVRNWGNCVVEQAKPIHETATSYIVTAAFIDLETGVTIERPFRQSKKWKVYGRMDDERKADVRFQIGTSKAIRNVVLNSLPGWLIDRMLDAGKASVLEQIKRRIKESSIETVRKQALDNLTKYGAKLENIETKIGLKYKQWQAEQLTLLSGDIRALAKGEESADVLFPAAVEQGKVETNNGLSAGDMKPGDPETHQGYEPPAEPAPIDPAPSGELPLNPAPKSAMPKEIVELYRMGKATQETVTAHGRRLAIGKYALIMSADDHDAAGKLLEKWAESDLSLDQWAPAMIDARWPVARRAFVVWYKAQ